jgi:hypothetical protein
MLEAKEVTEEARLAQSIKRIDCIRGRDTGIG